MNVHHRILGHYVTELTLRDAAEQQLVELSHEIFQDLIILVQMRLH